MGSLFFFLHGWGFLLQVVAIVHFIRRRPDTYWIFVILFLGWIGAAVYIAVEVIPDAGLLRGSVQAFPRRGRMRELEGAIWKNRSAGITKSWDCCIWMMEILRRRGRVMTGRL